MQRGARVHAQFLHVYHFRLRVLGVVVVVVGQHEAHERRRPRVSLPEHQRFDEEVGEPRIHRAEIRAGGFEPYDLVAPAADRAQRGGVDAEVVREHALVPEIPWVRPM